jgi:hypothetical protein
MARAPQPPQKQTIGMIVAVLMVMLALLFDAAQFLATFLHILPVVGNAAAVVFAWFITILATSIFAVWFALHDISYASGRGAGRRMLIALSAVVIELIPIIDALPAITIGVIGIIIESRIQDAQKAIAPKARPIRSRYTPPPVAANDNVEEGQRLAS